MVAEYLFRGKTYEPGGIPIGLDTRELIGSLLARPLFFGEELQTLGQVERLQEVYNTNMVNL